MRQKKKIFDYIESTTGWHVSDRTVKVSLPLYIKVGYELWSCSIAGLNIVLAKVKAPDTDIRRHYKAIEILGNKYGCKAVLVFETLDNRNIHRLVQKRTSFIVVDRYIYLPFALMQIQTEKTAPPPIKLKELTPVADTILVGYLDGILHSGMMITDIAEALGKDIRTTSLALSTLEPLKYLRLERRGRSKIIYFEDRQNMFERLKSEGKSPVKYIFFTDSSEIHTHATKSGYSALADYSSLMDGAPPTIAISSKARSLYTNDIECEEDDATYQVEVWDREPSIFGLNGSINPLYLLRLFKDETDERTEYALEDVEERIIQKIKATND